MPQKEGGRRRGKPYHKTVTRFVGPDGRRCRSTDPGAVRSVEETRSWYAWVGDEEVPLGTTDEGEAWRIYRAKLKEVRDRQAGIATPEQEQAATPLADLLAEFVKGLRDGDGTARHADLVEGRLEVLIELAGWKKAGEITEGTARTALAKLKEDGGRRGPGTAAGRSARTRNHYLTHLKFFCDWLENRGAVVKSPVRRLEPANAEADPVHPRRLPTPQDVAALLEMLARPDCRVRRGMVGPRRALLYKTAMGTGYRAGELRSLGWHNFDLEKGTVRARTAYQKNRRPRTQPLPPWLRDELAIWKASGGELWGHLDKDSPVKVLKADLKAAGVEYAKEGPDGPEYFDFHVLRSWYVTSVANTPGVTLKALLELSRHAALEVTLKHYARVTEGEVRAVADALPPVGVPGVVGCGNGCGTDLTDVDSGGPGKINRDDGESKKRPKKIAAWPGNLGDSWVD